MSTSIDLVFRNLQAFIQKYYWNELLKGLLLFSALWLLYFLSILLLENYFWLSTSLRQFIFWFFIVCSVLLFIKFIGFSLFKLLQLGKRISPLEASDIIGHHFPEIKDQLRNFIELHESNATSSSSELLQASIIQKSESLSPFTFTSAINFKNSLSFAKYLLIPFVVYFLISLFIGFDWYKQSFTRVVNYNTAFNPPAPFTFHILNHSLSTLENSDFTILVGTTGKVRPSSVQIQWNNQSYFLQQLDDSKFSYTFSSVTNDISFDLVSDNVKSTKYYLDVLDTPTITNLELAVTPPKHTSLPSSLIKNSGNVTVPEGSLLKWHITSPKSDSIHFIEQDSKYVFKSTKANYHYTRLIKNPLSYSISSSNSNVSNFENLDFSIDVVKDAFPFISVTTTKDTINDVTSNLHLGSISDDYGLKDLCVVYYETASPADINVNKIPFTNTLVSDFTYQFPGNLSLKKGVSYSYYFKVTDNDQVNNFKFSKSSTYVYNVLSDIEKEQELITKNQSQLNSFKSSLDNLEQSKSDLDKFTQLQKQSSTASFMQKKKLSSILDKQSKEQKKLSNLSEKLQKVLEKTADKIDTPKKDIQTVSKQLEQNNKLLDEIKKALDKLPPKALQKKVDSLNQQNKKITKNLNQILELTKRYFVIDKHQRIVSMLELLSNRQEELSNKAATPNAQSEINEQFSQIRKELDDLRKHNAELRKPLVLDDNPVYEGKIETKLKESKISLDDNKMDIAVKKQKTAAAMLQNLADKMSKTAAAGASAELKEDEESLRQILDNLVLFSKDQESNMSNFSNLSTNSPAYSTSIQYQNKLQDHFKHIQDSLFSLASRNPKIGIKINDYLSEVDYYLGNALDHITDNDSRLGVTDLRYVISNANDLSVLLAQDLKLINQRMKPGQGSSKEQGFQLPDIIKKQESLNKAFQSALESGQPKPGDSDKQGSQGQPKSSDKGKQGSNGENGEGDSPESGKSGSPGSQGESGSQGQQGNKGQSGQEGSSGQLGQPGRSGQPGQKGQEGQSGESGQSVQEGSSGKSGQGGQSGKQGSSGTMGKEGQFQKQGSPDSPNSKGNGLDSGKSKGKNTNKSNGKNSGQGNGSDSIPSDDSDSEENDYEKIFEIYQAQQNLRNQLENRLQQSGISTAETKRVLDQMKQAEKALIDNGLSQETLQRMQNIKHQLFKMKSAQFKQGIDENRKSSTSSTNFQNDKLTPTQIKNFFNNTEILTRDILPLQQEFKTRVNSYFSN